MKTTAPCMKCTKRFPGCHDTCREYNDWRQSKNMRQAQIRNAHHVDYEAKSARAYCIHRITREKEGQR